jgi:hypothetical protein
MNLKYVVVFLLMGCMPQKQALGQALYGQVIIADPASFALAKDGIWDFQYQLSLATGADFNINTKDSVHTSGIQIIKLDPLLNANYDKRLDPDNEDAVLIQSDGEHNLKIIAYSRQGLINGIYTYLDTLGFRWFHPGDKWAQIPRLKDIRLKCDAVFKPDFTLRTFFGTYGTPRNRVVDPKFTIDRDWNMWSMRNRLGGAYALHGHAWGSIVDQWHEYLDKRPEEMALVNGKRVSTKTPNAKFCLSNDDLQKVFIYHMTRELNRMMKENPDQSKYIVSVEPSDGEGDCECEACKKMGTVSTRVFFMANLVAREFQKISPKAYVNLYAYNTHAAVPDLDLEPNVIVQVIPYKYQNYYTSPNQMIEAWKKKSNNLFIYDYYGLPLLNVDMPLHNSLAPWRYAQRIKYWHQQNIKGMNLESSYSLGCTGVGLYLFARLGWNAQADEWQLLKEYYHACYGNASESVWQAQLALADDSLGKEKTLNNVMQKLQSETAKPKLDSLQKSRLTDFKAYTHYLKLLYEMQRVDGNGDALAVDNLLRYVYSIFMRKEVHPFPINEWAIHYGRHGSFVDKNWGTFNVLATGMKFNTVVPLTDEEIDKLFEEDCRVKR